MREANHVLLARLDEQSAPAKRARGGSISKKNLLGKRVQKRPLTAQRCARYMVLDRQFRSAEDNGGHRQLDKCNVQSVLRLEGFGTRVAEVVPGTALRIYG